MIFIDNDNTLGSKPFTQQLAMLIRPVLVQRLDDDELDDFDLALLQDMVHFGDFDADDFNAVLDTVQDARLDVAQQRTLIAAMQADPRYAKVS